MTAPPPPPSLDDRALRKPLARELFALGATSAAQLERAAEALSRQGGLFATRLVEAGVGTAEVVSALARVSGLTPAPVPRLRRPDPTAAHDAAPELCLRLLAAPFQYKEGRLQVAFANPLVAQREDAAALPPHDAFVALESEVRRCLIALFGPERVGSADGGPLAATGAVGGGEVPASVAGATGGGGREGTVLPPGAARAAEGGPHPGERAEDRTSRPAEGVAATRGRAVDVSAGSAPVDLDEGGFDGGAGAGGTGQPADETERVLGGAVPAPAGSYAGLSGGGEYAVAAAGVAQPPGLMPASRGGTGVPSSFEVERVSRPPQSPRAKTIDGANEPPPAPEPGSTHERGGAALPRTPPAVHRILPARVPAEALSSEPGLRVQPGSPLARVGPFRVLTRLSTRDEQVRFEARTDAGEPVLLTLAPVASANAQHGELPPRHPNVAALLSQGVAGGQAYWAHEFAEGEPLDALLTRLGALPAPVAAELFAQVLSGLGLLHGHGRVHGALAPSEVLVTREGGVKLLGIGVLASPARDARYVAPEAVNAREGEATARGDLFSAGRVLFAMLAGLDALRAHRAVALRPLLFEADPSVPPTLESLVERLTAWAPERRHESAVQALAELRPYLEAQRELYPLLVQAFLGNPAGMRQQMRRDQAKLALAEARSQLERSEVSRASAALILHRVTLLDPTDALAASALAALAQSERFSLKATPSARAVELQRIAVEEAEPAEPLAQLARQLRQEGLLVAAAVAARRYARLRPNALEALGNARDLLLSPTPRAAPPPSAKPTWTQATPATSPPSQGSRMVVGAAVLAGCAVAAAAAALLFLRG